MFGVVLTQPLSAGGFGEYVVVPAESGVGHVPAGLDLATAGVIGLAGSAAAVSIGAVSPAAGDLVLVSGATGGVGAIAMQMARARGADVIATAANPTEEEHVRALGATHVVNHTGDLTSQVRDIAPDGVDVVLHFAGDPVGLAGLLRPHGRFTSLLSAGPDLLGRDDITATPVYASPDRRSLEGLADDLAGGRLRIPVQRSYALDDVLAAFSDFGAGTRGKLAITIA